MTPTHINIETIITRFPSSPLIVRVPFFLLCGLRREPKKKKGKRVLLENLLGGSWDLVSGVISKVTTVIITYNPN